MSNVVPDSLNSFRQKQTSQRSPSSTANELQRSRGRGGGGVEESLRILRRSQGQTVRDAAKEQEDLAKQQAAQDRSDLERQMTRWWKEGDVYAPHDLSGAEMSKWKLPKARGKQSRDVCDILQLNPLDHYKVGFLQYFQPAVANVHTELLPYVRIYYRDGTYQRKRRDRSTTHQPAPHGKGDQESRRLRPPTQRA